MRAGFLLLIHWTGRFDKIVYIALFQHTTTTEVSLVKNYSTMRGESETGRQTVLTILFKKFSVNKSHSTETDVCVCERERDRERENNGLVGERHAAIHIYSTKAYFFRVILNQKKKNHYATIQSLFT